MPPNFTGDGEDRPSGCTAPDWGPNFCTCSICSAERQRQDEASEVYRQEARRNGLDPDADVMPLFIGLDLLTYQGLERLAKHMNVDTEAAAIHVLCAAIRVATKRKII